MFKCYVFRFIKKYKLLTLFISFFSILFFFNILQKYTIITPKQKSYFSEPIDVVYTWVNGSDPKFLQNLQDYLKINKTTARDHSSQRFDDKYELKFSLRSLEKYAPWIHHVYIVTNGQIPYWLNLDCEQITLITHEEIFVDHCDLPTFSSPAIESHLHRIPGLSDRFIYFNDDIFLGAPTFIDDFVSASRGFLIYLAWPLPMCALDCPWVYVGDGQCDSACLNANCQMDGGDCKPSNRVLHTWEDNFDAFVRSRDIMDSNLHNFSSNIKLISSRNTHNVIVNKTNERNLRFYTKEDFSRDSTNSTKEKVISNETKPNSNIRTFFYAKNTTNVTSIVWEYNKNILLHNKLHRRKYRMKRNRNLFMGDFANGTFIRKIRSEGRNVDAYGESLQNTNRIYNIRYGFKSRYVPTHSPILIDKSIMIDLQAVFEKEFRKTSYNKVRGEDDMQYAFSYYYYLINERKNLSIEEIFDRFDTDNSGTWSDREIRTILTKLYDLPLSYATVDHFEDMLLNCSHFKTFPEIPTPEFERYVDSKLPTVSKELVKNCASLSVILKEHFGMKRKYKYDLIHNAQSSHVIFKMLSSNISEVVGHLDEIRRHTKKFICLNDNMDDLKRSENELIRAVLYDFYLSLFPTPSKFELPTDFRNRFLYIDELNQWKQYHLKLRFCMYFCVSVLCYVLYCNLHKRRMLYRFINKIFC